MTGLFSIYTASHLTIIKKTSKNQVLDGKNYFHLAI